MDRSVQARVSLAWLCLIGLLAGNACGQTTADPEKVKPKVYGLIAAVGAEFSLVTEVPTTGSHLSPYRRTTTDVPLTSLTE